MANVEFHDFSVQVTEAMNDAVLAFLHEAAGEVEAQTKRNSTPGEKYRGRDAQALWSYNVDERNQEATVGSPYEAAYWEELGTGEHALNKDGRKGWWVYIEGGSGYSGRTNVYHSREEAERMAAYIRSKYGLDAHATNGRKPNRPLFRAFNEKKGALERRAAEILKEGLK